MVWASSGLVNAIALQNGERDPSLEVDWFLEFHKRQHSLSEMERSCGFL